MKSLERLTPHFFCVMMRMFAYILVFSALTAQSMDKFQKNA